MTTLTRWCNKCGKRVPLNLYTQKTTARTQKKCDPCLKEGEDEIQNFESR